MQDCQLRYAFVTSPFYNQALRTNKTNSDLIFNVPQLVSFLSQGTTLLPGSIIMTGTPKGVGFVKKPPVYLKNGDDMNVWLDAGVGTLVNPVVEERGNEKAKL